MAHFKHSVLVAAAVLTLAGCAQSARPAADTAADEAAIRDAGTAWFTAYNAGDADAVAALYADDGVVNNPGAPPARGPAIRGAIAKDVADSRAGGFSLKPAPESEVGVSGDLAWEWNTFTVADSSGATVDAGKYVTVFQRKDGKWQIIRDIWNSDNPPASPAAATTAN